MARPTNLTPAEISLRAQLAVHTSWANTTDIEARTQPGLQAANVTRFEKLVDPDGILDPDVRARMVEHARQAHLKRIALASAKARRLRKQAKRLMVPTNGAGEPQ